MMKIGNKVKGTFESDVVFQYHLDKTAEAIIDYYDKHEPNIIAYNSEGYFLKSNPTSPKPGRMLKYNTSYGFLSQILEKLMYDHVHRVHNWDKEIEFILENIYQCLPSYITLHTFKDRKTGKIIKSFRVSCPKEYKSSRYVGTYRTFMEAYAVRKKMLNKIYKIRQQEYDRQALLQTLKAPKGLNGMLGVYA